MDYFEPAVTATLLGMETGGGGPFGATVVRDGEVLLAVGNKVVADTDPSQHAEMVAVREACQQLGTLDLSDCTVYATCQPCPMCVSVLIWAGIKTVHYSSTCEDADRNGWSDMHLRSYLRGEDDSVLTLVPVGRRTDCDALFGRFTELNPDWVPHPSMISSGS